MSAPQRVSSAAIVEALKVCGGNLRATAQHCGISRNALKKRIVSMGVDVEAIRPPVPVAPAAGSVVYAAPRSPRAPARVLPAHQDLLREARFDLQAKRRVDLTDSDVLEEFIEDAFAEWLRAELA